MPGVRRTPMRARGVACAAFAIAMNGCAAARESEYEHYVHQACAELQRRQDELNATYKLSTWPRYDWKQDTGELVFSEAGVPKVVAHIQFVGSFSKTSRTWR